MKTFLWQLEEKQQQLQQLLKHHQENHHQFVIVPDLHVPIEGLTKLSLKLKLDLVECQHRENVKEDHQVPHHQDVHDQVEQLVKSQNVILELVIEMFPKEHDMMTMMKTKTKRIVNLIQMMNLL